MGLPTSGKTTLAQALAKSLNAVWINADKIRCQSDNFDFSNQGRMKQAWNMRLACDEHERSIADFVCPTRATRRVFGYCDLLIWMNTIQKSPYRDTDEIFVPPEGALVIEDWNTEASVEWVLAHL